MYWFCKWELPANPYLSLKIYIYIDRYIDNSIYGLYIPLEITADGQATPDHPSEGGRTTLWWVRKFVRRRIPKHPCMVSLPLFRSKSYSNVVEYDMDGTKYGLRSMLLNKCWNLSEYSSWRGSSSCVWLVGSWEASNWDREDQQTIPGNQLVDEIWGLTLSLVHYDIMMVGIIYIMLMFVWIENLCISMTEIGYQHSKQDKHESWGNSMAWEVVPMFKFIKNITSRLVVGNGWSENCSWVVWSFS